MELEKDVGTPADVARRQASREKGFTFKRLEKSFPGITGYLLKQAPPGAPPRPGLEWDAQKHRWIKPERQLGGGPITSDEKRSMEGFKEQVGRGRDIGTMSDKFLRDAQKGAAKTYMGMHEAGKVPKGKEKEAKEVFSMMQTLDSEIRSRGRKE